MALTDTNQNESYSLLLQELEARPLNAQAQRVLADTVGQLRWVQEMPVPFRALTQRHPPQAIDRLPDASRVGCPGVRGAYTHMACEKMFGVPELSFFEEFYDVVEAVQNCVVDYGVLPVENSSAGQVSEVLKLLSARDLYICQTTEIKIDHCLCIHPGSDPKGITAALSHPQALAQCQSYLREKGLRPERFSNTATAAQKVGEAPSELACVCSFASAGLYGLKVLARDIQDYDENYTRFICISPRNLLLPGADTISIALTLPHEPGYLNKILTRFAACDLDLTRLLSMPIASRDFSVLFFLDFRGSIKNPQVEHLLGALRDETAFFKFLGNYNRLP